AQYCLDVFNNRHRMIPSALALLRIPDARPKSTRGSSDRTGANHNRGGSIRRVRKPPTSIRGRGLVYVGGGEHPRTETYFSTSPLRCSGIRPFRQLVHVACRAPRSSPSF